MGNNRKTPPQAINSFLPSIPVVPDERPTEELNVQVTLESIGEVKRLPVHHLRLRVVKGIDSGTTCQVDMPHVTIGTGSTNDLRLRDRRVSRHHCQIFVRDGNYVIRDQGSRNGVYVNGVRVYEAAIEPQTIITIGLTQVAFEPECDAMVVLPYEHHEFCGMRGRSKAMAQVFGLLSEVASSNLTCLITGETGTGKELAARALHLNSERAKRPFLVVDCASVGSQFLEDKIFGHAQGAYTGANRAVAGVFEEANGGSVFLDEVGELPLELQPKLLRVIERREATRIGSHKAMKLDVRLIAATHRDLPAMVREGAFREDLYYRLAEITIAIPPLRERREDIALIVKAVLDEEGRVGQSLTDDAFEYLRSCDWPGNVRELRNLIRRASALTKSSHIDRKLLEELNASGVTTQGLEESPQQAEPVELIGANLPLNEANEVYRKAYTQYIRDRFGNDLNRASLHTGLHPKSISRLFRKYGVY